MSVHNVATKQNGDFDEITGTAFAPDPNHPGELIVTFPGSKYTEEILLSSVAESESEPVEPKLFEIWSRSRNYLFNKYFLPSVWRMIG